MFALQPQNFVGGTGFSNSFGYGRPINPNFGWQSGINQLGVVDPITYELHRVALHYQALQQLAIQQQLAAFGGLSGQWPLQAGFPVQTPWPIQPFQLTQLNPMGPLAQRYASPITEPINAIQPQLVPVA